MRFHKVLRRLKGEKSNAQLALEIGKSPTFVGQMMQGNSLPGDATLDKISEILGERDQLYLAAGKIPREVTDALVGDTQMWDLVRALAGAENRSLKVEKLLEYCKNGMEI